MLLVAACLYWAGMLLHDAFKWEAAREHGRPVPLPQGIVSTTSAFATSILLMLVGVGAAGFVSTAAGLAAVVVGILLVVFASITREIVFFSHPGDPAWTGGGAHRVRLCGHADLP